MFLDVTFCFLFLFTFFFSFILLYFTWGSFFLPNVKLIYSAFSHFQSTNKSLEGILSFYQSAFSIYSFLKFTFLHLHYPSLLACYLLFPYSILSPYILSVVILNSLSGCFNIYVIPELVLIFSCLSRLFFSCIWLAL